MNIQSECLKRAEGKDKLSTTTTTEASVRYLVSSTQREGRIYRARIL